MKNLTMIVHAAAQRDLADHFRGLEHVDGFTFTHVEGHGPGMSKDHNLSARDKVVGYVPHIRVDVLLEDDYVEEVLAQLCDTPGIASMGIYWVSDVLQQGRL